MSHTLKFSFILIFLFIFEEIEAQSTKSETENRRLKYPSAISWYLSGPSGHSSISYDRFLTPHLNAEAGYALVSVHVGLKIHLWGASNRKWTPYLGTVLAYGLFPETNREYLPYFPLGIQFVGDNHLNFSFELAPIQPAFSAWNIVGIKFGYRW